jgi:membrane dipeptidase
MTRGTGPLWVDAHAHPGRCFLRGLGASDRFVAALGADASEASLGQLREAGVGIACFSTVADLRVIGVGPDGGLAALREFAPGEAREDHARQMDALRELSAHAGARAILGPADVARLDPGHEVGVLVGCEGGDFLEGRIERVAEAHAAGARILTLVHYRVNELGDIQTEPPRHGGLTAFGAEVVREMNRLGMIVDCAHATWEVTRDVLDVTSAPVMISHSHLARGASPHPRLISEKHALAVTSSGGIVGAWPAGVALASFDDYLDEILRMVDLLGAGHVAIGTDMDANYRPVLTHYGELPDVACGLAERGLRGEALERVMGGNVLGLFERVSSDPPA